MSDPDEKIDDDGAVVSNGPSFDNDVEHFEAYENDDDDPLGPDDDDDDDAIDLPFVEQRTVPQPSAATDNVRAIPGVPVEASEPTDLDRFLSSLPTDQEVSIVIYRRADAGLRFRIPNAATKMHIDTRVWGRESPEEIYTEIARTHGGGRYYFQLRTGKGFSPHSWEQTISDPADMSERERLMVEAKSSEQQSIPVSSQPVAKEEPDEDDVIEKMFDRMERYQNLFDRMRGPQHTSEPAASVKDQILLEAMRKAPDGAELNALVVKKAMSIVSEEKKNVWDVLMYGLEHGDRVMDIAGKAFGMIGPLIFKPAAPAFVPPSVPLNMPVPQTIIPTAPATATGFVTPPAAPPEGVPAVPEAETPPAAPQIALKPMKSVEW